MNDKKIYHGSKRNPLKITISWIFVFWRGKSHKLGHVATLSGLVLGPILMTSLRIVIFWPQICKGNILPVQLIPKVISFSIWTQFYRSKHCQSSTLTDWNQTSTTSQKWLNFKRKPLYLIRTIKELIESYSFLDITNPHSVIDVVIPIIVISLQSSLEIKLFWHNTRTLSIDFAFAGAESKPKLRHRIDDGIYKEW